MHVAKTKALIIFSVTAKLICAFVSAYVDCLFSYDAAHIFNNFRLAGMFSYFGIQFDVPQLSGNLYLNMFLVAIADVPSSLCVAILNLK